jgi:tRNA-2-methylthio-N6-dimethylallyladenosine synthase
MATTFFIETHGCQMNEHDSERISGVLSHRGMVPVPTLEEADLYILNTCSVREKAAQKVYSRLGQVKNQKIRNPNFLIGVVGCVAQQESEEMVKKAPFVDMVVGTHLYHSIPDLLDELESRDDKSGRSSLVTTGFLNSFRPSEISQVRRGSEFRAGVTIMEGCNKHCTFCIVPYTRGPEHSRPAEEVIEEVRRAAKDGYVEIQLLGQTVNSYKDPGRKSYRFAELLADVAQVQGARRIRFTSPHPRHFTDDVLAVIAQNENICNQIHLPAQSGSDSVLRRMRRQHDRDWYLTLVDKLAATGREIALSTDMIVGFPGETESDFEDTLTLVEAVRYEQMFSFKYSPRPSTEAFTWEDDVAEEIKARRLLKLQRLQREIQLEIHDQRYLNRNFEVLVEGTARDGVRKFGRTTTNKVVNFFGTQAPGDFLTVQIVTVGPNSLQGEEIKLSAGAESRRQYGARV